MLSSIWATPTFLDCCFTMALMSHLPVTTIYTLSSTRLCASRPLCLCTCQFPSLEYSAIHSLLYSSQSYASFENLAQISCYMWNNGPCICAHLIPETCEYVTIHGKMDTFYTIHLENCKRMHCIVLSH